MNERWIQRVWRGEGFFARLGRLPLIPFSLGYWALSQTRNALYALGCLRRCRLDIPVISIGNLTVGGTGKTPACLWLAAELERRGLRVAILSRGYKRREIERVAILSPVSNARSPAKAAAETGDEPGMIAALYGKTVAVARRRYEAGRALLERGSWDVFLLDDGYQHRRLERDLDLLVLGADCRGWVLPAGPFREPRSALRRAHAFLITGAEEYWARRLEAEGRGPSFRASLEAKCLIGWEAGRLKEAPLARLDRSRIVAVAGIANPDGFFNMIYDWGGDIVAALRFPDHHAFGLEDWQRIGRVSRDADLIITTEKDLLKLAGFPFAKDKLFALRVAMVVENGDRLVQTIAHTIGLRAAAGKSVEAEKG